MADLPQDIYQPQSMHRDAAHAILMMTAKDTEDLEFFYPYYRFIEAGYKVDVATPGGGAFAAKHGLGLKETMKLEDIGDPTSYDLLYIPGGKAPEQLKKEDKAIEIVKNFAATGKPIAAICHGPQLLAKADVIRGRQIAAWPDVEGEVKAAGAEYVNRETIIDGQFITARWPADLPAHMKATLAVLAHPSSAKKAA